MSWSVECAALTLHALPLRNAIVVRGQPGSRFPQVEQVESVTRLPVPQEGQRFIPSVDVAYGFTRDASSPLTRSRRRITTTARMPTAAMPIRARIWELWSKVRLR